MAAHLLAVLLLLNAFQETARYPVAIDLLNTCQYRFYDEIPEYGGTWIKDNVYDISEAGAAGLRTAFRLLFVELVVREAGLFAVSDPCHGLAAPQQTDESVLIMGSTTPGGTAAPQEGTETALTTVSNMCDKLSAPQEVGETALAVVDCCGVCTDTSFSDAYDLDICPKRASNEEIILAMVFVTLTVVTVHMVLTYRAIQKFIHNPDEEFIEVDIIVVVIEPTMFDNRRHG